MSKKILSLILAAVMLFGALAMTGCSLFEKKEPTASDDRLPTTLNLLGVTEASTTPEAVAAVEEQINKILVAKYETKIKLTLVTEDEYYKLIDGRIAEKRHLDNLDKAVAQYNKYMQKLADEQARLAATIGKKSNSKWKKKNVTIPAETVSTRLKYTAEQTTVDEGGIISIVYPDPESPIDIVMISGKEMYDYFDKNSVIASISAYLKDESYQKLNQYIYPTYFSQISAMTGDVKAVPSNNLLAEYTYIVVKKDLADRYNFNIENVSNYSDLAGFLASVKKNESIKPMKDVPDALGIFYPFGKDVAIATYADPIYGYNVEEGKKFTISNLFDIPQYTEHLRLMSEYKSLGYFEGDGDSFAAAAIVGDASVEKTYGDDYYVKVVQNPFVTETDIFDGMMAVSAYTSDEKRSLEVIQAFSTTPELKNLLQYGIKNVNYSVNEDGLTIKRLNSDYMMKTSLTGNVYMGYPDENQYGDQWKYYKVTNLSSILSPFLVYYMNDNTVDGEMNNILKRVALEEAFGNVGTTYDWYLENESKASGANKFLELKRYYKDYLKECLRADGVTEANLNAAIEGNHIRNSDWFIGKLVDKFVGEKYADIVTSAGVDALVQKKLSDIIGVSYTKVSTGNSFEKYRNDAAQYYTNIKYLRIMADMLLFTEMDEAEKARYNDMSDTEFEKALLAFVTENYIKKNDLTDEKYSELVKTYICSLMTFSDDLGNTYSVAWDDIAETLKKAEPFVKASEKMKEVYADILAENRYNTESASATPAAVVTKIHELLYMQYLADNGVSMAEFQNSIYDEIFAPYGLTKTTADELRKKDKTTYDSYISKIKSKYKSAIRDVYSAEKYKEKGAMALTASEILAVVVDYIIEEKTQIYHTMCHAANISYNEFRTTRAHMADYIKYVNMMKTKNTYTLSTVYTKNEINSLKYNEIQDTVYKAIYDVGYYTNEMVKLVGSSLAEYTSAKSSASKYITSIGKLIDYYKDQIIALGYDIDDFRNMDPDVIENIVYEIATKECSAGKITLETYMQDISKKYVDGLATADNIEEYCKEASKALHGDALFDAIPKELDRAKEAALAEETK